MSDQRWIRVRASIAEVHKLLRECPSDIYLSWWIRADRQSHHPSRSNTPKACWDHAGGISPPCSTIPCADIASQSGRQQQLALPYCTRPLGHTILHASDIQRVSTTHQQKSVSGRYQRRTHQVPETDQSCLAYSSHVGTPKCRPCRLYLACCRSRAATFVKDPATVGNAPDRHSLGIILQRAQHNGYSIADTITGYQRYVAQLFRGSSAVSVFFASYPGGRKEERQAIQISLQTKDQQQQKHGQSHEQQSHEEFTSRHQDRKTWVTKRKPKNGRRR